MKNTKLSYHDALTTAIDLLDSYQIAEVDTQPIIVALTSIRDSIDKRNQRQNDKPTKTQVANEGFKGEIVAFLADGKHATVSEIIKGVASLNGETTQKVSALCRLLKLEGKIDKEVVKGKTLFYLL